MRVVSFQEQFKKTCDSDGVSKGVVIRLLRFSTANVPVVSLTICSISKKEVVAPAIVCQGIKRRNILIHSPRPLITFWIPMRPMTWLQILPWKFNRSRNSPIRRLYNLPKLWKRRHFDKGMHSLNSVLEASLWRNYPWISKTTCECIRRRDQQYISDSLNSMKTRFSFWRAISCHLQQSLNNPRVGALVKVTVVAIELDCSDRWRDKAYAIVARLEVPPFDWEKSRCWGMIKVA